MEGFRVLFVKFLRKY